MKGEGGGLCDRPLEISQRRKGRDLEITSQSRETSGWNNLSEDKRTIPAQRASYTALPDTDAQDQNCDLSNFEHFWAAGEMDGKTMKRYGIDWKTVVMLQCRPNNLLHFQHWCNCTSKPTHSRVSKKSTSIITHRTAVCYYTNVKCVSNSSFHCMVLIQAWTQQPAACFSRFT